MTQKFTAEEVLAEAQYVRAYSSNNPGTKSDWERNADMLTAYAERIEADERAATADSGRVDAPTDEQIIAVCRAAGIRWIEPDEGGCGFPGGFDITYMTGMRNLFVALAAQGHGEAVEIEAVGRVERDMTGDLGINWLIEGGIHGVGEGSVLLCADRDNVTDDEGSATLYTSAPPASPAGVPDGMVLVPWEPEPVMLAIYEHIRSGSDWQAHVFRLTKRQLNRHRAAYKAMIAAAPSAPTGE